MLLPVSIPNSPLGGTVKQRQKGDAEGNMAADWEGRWSYGDGGGKGLFVTYSNLCFHSASTYGLRLTVRRPPALGPWGREWRRPRLSTSSLSAPARGGSRGEM
uniref:Uncharacterized protein n=1 Tax=Oryza glaberrima TaxID=4538 RepID=I1Q1G6_ORYGL